MSRLEVIATLRRHRPVDRFARTTVVALGALTAWAWLGGTFDFGTLSSDRALRNLARFLRDIRPYELRDHASGIVEYGRWLVDKLEPDAGVALLSTLAMAVAAIVLAGAAAAVLALPAARTWASPEPFLPESAIPSAFRRAVWVSVVMLTRGALIFVRAVPEYVWAFLFLPLVGLGPWPAVLALAVHNTGILGKLYAELVENGAPSAARALRAAGASRLQIAAATIAPQQTGRALLYLFYRWETCVRESTVLGLLGFLSLGWFVQDARAGLRYDEMVHWIGLGALLIVAGDVVSGIVRRRIRRG